MKKVELLAPAGSKEALIAAVNSGADAVYLAGKSFGARASATNFSNDEIKEAIKFAHVRNVKIYVTVNTVIFDNEMEMVLEFIKFLYLNDVDGVIIQDLGLLSIVNKLFPSLKLIASTQMNVHNFEHALLLKSMGVKRIVVAREMSYKQIKELKEKIDLEIEAFAHGAICVCYSGNCLMSSFIGKRSGNRGRCAQPCRLPYKLVNENDFSSEVKYWMSPKELYTLEQMDSIFKANIDSIKIEGRMKGPEYVATSVRLYRKLIDQYYLNQNSKVEENDELELRKLFNRDFTKGHIGEVQPYTLVNPFRPNHLGIKIGKTIAYQHNKVALKLEHELNQGDGIRIIGEKDDIGFMVNRLYLKGLLVNKALSGDIVELDSNEKIGVGLDVVKTSDVKQLEAAKKALETTTSNRLINAKFRAALNADLELTLIDEFTKKEATVILPIKPSLAINNPTTVERIIQQLEKLNDTPFKLNHVQINIENNLYLPVSVINQIRRETVDKLSNILERNYDDYVVGTFPNYNLNINKEKIGLCVKVHTIEQLISAIDLNVKTIYYDDEATFNEAIKIKNDIIPCISRINYQVNEKINSNVILAQELGTINKYVKSKKVISDAYLNVVNHYTVATLFDLGVTRVTLSPEISLKRIKQLIITFNQEFAQAPNLELIVYGRYDLMISKYCPITTATNVNRLHCNQCQVSNYSLVDRLEFKFPIIANNQNCHVRILNSKRVHLIEYVQELIDLGISSLRLEFTIESKDEVSMIISEYQRVINKLEPSLHLNALTYGHFIDDIE